MSRARFTTGDGCTIAYEFLHDAAKPVLVLSPSLGTSMALFDAQVRALGEHFSLLRYDPRGHGASGTPEGAYSLDRLGLDVVELLDHLRIDRSHFCGVSLGGMTGQWLGYRVPDRVDCLVLANTSAYMGPPSGWEERVEAVRQNGMQAVLEPVIGRWFTPWFRNRAPAEVDAVRALLAATDPQGYAGCSAAIRDMDLRPTAKLIDVPCLVISGSKDPATPPEHAALLAASISHAKLLSLEAAHLSNIEQAEAFNQGVLTFLLDN